MKKVLYAVFITLSSLAFCPMASPQKPSTPTCSCNALKPKPKAKAKTVQVKRPAPPQVPALLPPTQATTIQVAAPAIDMSVLTATLLEDQRRTGELLLLQKQNDAANIALQTTHLQNVDEIADRAETRQEKAEALQEQLVGAEIVNNNDLTKAKVGLMHAEGRAMQIDAVGNLIGAGLSPLTAWLGRTQISVEGGTGNGGNATGGSQTQSQAANPTATGGSQSQSQAANPTANGGSQSQSQVNP